MNQKLLQLFVTGPNSRSHNLYTQVNCNFPLAKVFNNLLFVGAGIIQWTLLNGVNIIKKDTRVKQTPRVGPCLSLLPLSYWLYKTDITLRWTLTAGPKGVHSVLKNC